MNKLSTLFLFASITAILFTSPFVIDYAFAGKGENNGNNGCEKSNPNSKACEKNPNTIPSNTPPTIDSVTVIQNGVDISDSFAVNNKPVECMANNVNDVDGDTVSLFYEWIRLDTGLLFSTDATLIGFPVGGLDGEIPLICIITPFDGTDFGESASQTFGMRSSVPGGGL